MDPKNNLEATIQNIISQNPGVPEDGDSTSILKIPDIDSNLGNNVREIITNAQVNVPGEQSLQTEIKKKEANIISLDKSNYPIDKELCNSPILSNLVTPLTRDGVSEISNIIISTEQCAEGKINNENDTKLFPDDESCSDMQDEEIQLRWDDDDINLDCEDVESLIEERTCKDSEDMIVEDKYLEKIHEKIEIASPEIANHDMKKVMFECEKNDSQCDCQNSSNEKMCENKCKVVTKQDECLTVVMKHDGDQIPAQVNDDSGLNQYMCEDISTQNECKGVIIDQENKKILTEYENSQIATQLKLEENITQPKCKETAIQQENDNVTDVDNKIDYHIEEKKNFKQKSGHVTSEETIKNLNKHGCQEVVYLIDNERRLTVHEHEKIAAIVEIENSVTQIKTEQNTTQVDYGSSESQYKHDAKVTLMNNETSISQQQSEENATLVEKEKSMMQTNHNEISAIVDNERDITESETKKNTAQIACDKNEKQLEHDRIVTLMNNEECISQHQSEESVTIVGNETNVTQSQPDEIVAIIDNERDISQIETKENTTHVDYDNSELQHKHNEIVHPTNNEKIVSKNQSEENATIVGKEKYITQSRHDKITATVDNVKDITQFDTKNNLIQVNNDKCVNQHLSERNVTNVEQENNITHNELEEIVAPVDDNKLEYNHEKEDIPPQVNKEKSVFLSECEEIATQHGLKKPDMMLEIPTQDLIDFIDDDEPDLLGTLEMSSDETAIEIPNDNNGDVEMIVNNDAINARNMDIEMENNKMSEFKQGTPNVYEKNFRLMSEDQSEVFSETSIISLTEPTDNEKEQNNLVRDPQPSTSKACMITEMRRDSDEVGEVSDSLGLLAESTRVLEDDEEQDDDDDADDEDDYDQYEESSNQMGAEFSEDSNAVTSETDTVKVTEIGKINVDKCKAKEQKEMDYIVQENDSCGFHITDIKTQSDDHKDISKSMDRMAHSQILIPEEREQEIVEIIKSPVNNIDNIKDTDTINISAEVPTQDNERISGVIETDLPSPKNEIQESTLDEEDEVVLLETSSDEDVPVETTNITCQIEMPLASIDVPNLNSPQQTVEKNDTLFDEILEKNYSEKSSIHKTSFHQKSKSPRGLEVFSIDSDDDDVLSKNDEEKSKESELREVIKCVNISCGSSRDEQYYEADAAVLKYYEADRGKKAAVCGTCADAVFKRNRELIEGIKNNTPLLELDMGKQIVEISDSDSEVEKETVEENSEKIGEAGAKFMEEKLAEIFNATWQKFNMDSRLDDAQSVIQQELNRLEKETQEINQMLNECQSETDKLRNELYSTFEQERKMLPPIVIFDTEYNVFCEYEDNAHEKLSKTEKRTSKRKSVVNDVPAKKLAIANSRNSENAKHVQETKTEPSPRKIVDDDNVDVSVVKLSVESAPADLPQPGEVVKPPLRTGMTVYAMKNNFGIWLKARIVEIQIKNPSSSPFTMCRLKFEHKVVRNAFITLPARCIAFEDPPDVRLTIGTRVIASSEKNGSFYSGVVAEVPNPVNNYRYLVFFDDGHAKYARHANTRLVCECSPLVWEEVHPNSREFVRQYLLSYPERPMVRLHPNQSVKAEWNGKWWHSRVIEVDASLALILLAGDRMEWIYRGSTRLGPLYLEFQAAERQRSRPMPRSGPQNRTNVPYVEYTRYDEPSKQQTSCSAQQNDEMRRQRAVAKKSTVSSQLPLSVPPAPPNNAANLDNITSRVVYYTPKNAIRPYKMVPHQCGPKCKRTDVLALKDLRTYNPLAKPLLSAWERQIVRFKGHKEVMYRAPCGRRLRNMEELHRYLRAVKSDMPVDLFDFGPSTHCLVEFVLNKCLVGKKDLSHGKENVPVPCVNYYDESLPEFCSYNTERTPTAGVPLNLDPEFLCGCDCDDDCQDKTKCACWKMTLEGARTIGLEGDVGYVYRRLPDPLPTGIYECNSRCKCKNTCLNRVAQHPLQLKLQVFKTLNRGWGIRALNDVPKGAFLCVYAGNLLTDATANLDGLNEGDEYLAELDYIEVVEQMKEGYEEDIPESLKETAKDGLSSEEFSENEDSSSEEEDLKNSKDERDDDFRPGYVDVGPIEFNKRLRTREKRKKEKPDNPKEEDSTETNDVKLEMKQEEKPEENLQEIQQEKEGEKEKDNGDDEFITISDDEEVREPSRFTAQAGMDSKHLISKYRSVRSYFGKDEACYIMDAKVQGNIGRYLNHSCCPNVFVQNVFVDTHDPRFPWVAFFALSHIRAGTELTWNYNYDVGSVPGKILYCYCGAVNCRGRLL